MDLNITTLDIINHIITYDYFDTLAGAEISKRMGSYDKLNKLREKNQQHLARYFEGVKFHDHENQLQALSKLKETVRGKIEGLSKKDIEELTDVLKKMPKK